LTPAPAFANAVAQIPHPNHVRAQKRNSPNCYSRPRWSTSCKRLVDSSAAQTTGSNHPTTPIWLEATRRDTSKTSLGRHSSLAAGQATQRSYHTEAAIHSSATRREHSKASLRADDSEAAYGREYSKTSLGSRHSFCSKACVRARCSFRHGGFQARSARFIYFPAWKTHPCLDGAHALHNQTPGLKR